MQLMFQLKRCFFKTPMPYGVSFRGVTESSLKDQECGFVTGIGVKLVYSLLLSFFIGGG